MYHPVVGGESDTSRVQRRWRFYRTAAGREPVREFLDGLDNPDRDEVLAGMRDVQDAGMVVARHLKGDIYEVRADSRGQAFRVLFASEGSKGRVLLAIEGFSKKTQRTPPPTIELAERRLADWRARAR